MEDERSTVSNHARQVRFVRSESSEETEEKIIAISARSSVGYEHCPDKAGVGGSNPPERTIIYRQLPERLKGMAL